MERKKVAIKRRFLPHIKLANFILLLNTLLFLMCGCAHHVLQSIPPEKLTTDSCYSTPMVYYLPKGKIKVQYKPVADPKAEINFTADTVYVPDASKSYILNYLGNIGYDDTVTVTLTDNGLLSRVNITAESKVGEIVMRVIDIAKEAAKIFAMPPLPGGPAPPPVQFLSFNVTIDPDDIMKATSQDWEQTRQKKMSDLKFYLAKRGAGDSSTSTPDEEIEIKKLYTALETDKDINAIEKLLLPCGVSSVRLKRLEPERWLSLQSKMGTLEKSEDPKTIYYRPVWPYELRFVHANFVLVQTVYLPNYEPVIPLNISRPAFVKAVNNLTFKDGILTEVHLEKPSELLAGLKIPLDIVKAFAAIPGELLQFKIKYGTDYNTYLNQQIQEIKLKQQLQELKGAK